MLSTLILAFFATTTLETPNLASSAILLPFPIVEVAKAEEIEPIQATSTTPSEIKEFFGDSRMVGVIKCESNFKQFRGTSTPLMSPTSDVGVAQINQIHWKRAKELGLDIHKSMQDNLEMAKIIYKEQGINAWVCFRLVNDG